MGVGSGHHVKIGVDHYIVKYDSKSALEYTYQNPFVARQSVAASRSEGNYDQDMVFTQRSFAQGEGQGIMAEGGEQRYWESEDMDISGSDATLRLLHKVEAITGAGGQPDMDALPAVMEPGHDGVYLLFPVTVDHTNETKQLWKWDGSAWVGSAPIATGRSSDTAGQMVFLGGYMWICGGSGIARVAPGGTGFETDFNTSDGPVGIGTDGTTLFCSYFTTVGDFTYSEIYTISTTADSRSLCSGRIDGEVTTIKEHGGTMYALAFIEDAEQTALYKYDGTNFELYKILPDGFVGYTLRSDGSSLYIGGQQKCAEGNYRGQIYYLTGSSSSEALGNLATFGERDGVSNYTLTNLRTHGKSVYFGWMHYGGLGRYDTVNGGISRSYRRQETSGNDNSISRICLFLGTPYFLVYGSDATTDPTAVYQVSNSNFVASGYLSSSYVDFGLPGTQKLFTSVTLCAPAAVDGGTGDVGVEYSLDGDIDTWTSLTSSLAGEDYTGDSGGRFWKYTLPLNNTGGIKAHSLAVRLTLTPNSAATATPALSWVSTNAITLLRAPGSTEPRKLWHFNLVLARSTRSINHAEEDAQAKLETLRGQLESQAPVTLETVADKGTTYNVLLNKLSEINGAYSEKEGYEATVEVECLGLDI